MNPIKPSLIYEWDVAQIGHSSSSYTYEVTAEKIANYCKAVGYENSIYINCAAARALGHENVFAPPAMLYTFAPQRRDSLIASTGYLAPEQSPTDPRSTPFVGSTIRFSGMPVQPGDIITSTTVVEKKFERSGNRFITFLVQGFNQRGDKVADYSYTCIWERKLKM